MRLHDFKTSAALGFKLCIRAVRMCREISEQVSHSEIRGRKSSRSLIFYENATAVLKGWQPNSFKIALLCCFLPNCLSVMYISLRDTMVHLSQGIQNRHFRPLVFSGDAFFPAGDHAPQWLKLSHSLGSPHVYPESYPITLIAQCSD